VRGLGGGRRSQQLGKTCGTREPPPPPGWGGGGVVRTTGIKFFEFITIKAPSGARPSAQ